MRTVKITEDKKYALKKQDDGTYGIYAPDGEGGWYCVQDDGRYLYQDFEYHVENLREEMRYLIAAAKIEFGF
ncbi:hypothetical protein LCGC14_1779670 [marine sediment metagenome]|uniref:Uncharacterized protein n=1 Tax=marine sediment metagenome TaxID=412755 RepID=A0A0F9JVH2_9ZZZZ